MTEMEKLKSTQFELGQYFKRQNGEDHQHRPELRLCFAIWKKKFHNLNNEPRRSVYLPVSPMTSRRQLSISRRRRVSRCGRRWRIAEGRGRIVTRRWCAAECLLLRRQQSRPRRRRRGCPSPPRSRNSPRSHCLERRAPQCTNARSTRKRNKRFVKPFPRINRTPIATRTERKCPKPPTPADKLLVNENRMES